MQTNGFTQKLFSWRSFCTEALRHRSFSAMKFLHTESLTHRNKLFTRRRSQSEDLLKRRCVWKKMWHWRNIKIWECENEKMRRYGRCDGYIFHRAEIPENTLRLYFCVNIYIFRNHFRTEVFYIRTNIFPTRASIQRHWYSEVFKFNGNLIGQLIVVIFFVEKHNCWQDWGCCFFCWTWVKEFSRFM